MSSDQVRTGEAIAVLRTRLESWGIEDAAERAQAFIADMIRNGWRPRALPAPSIDLARPTGVTSAPTEEYRAARAAAKGATA